MGKSVIASLVHRYCVKTYVLLELTFGNINSSDLGGRVLILQGPVGGRDLGGHGLAGETECAVN